MFLTLLCSVTLAAPSVDEILAKIDTNLTFDTRSAKITMEVVNPRRTRTFQMQTFGRGEDLSAIEYLSPSRDKGTKMLKDGDELWMYMPSVERTQKISGHMLRQGMMGSDVSYEDMMEASNWRDNYTAAEAVEDTFDGRPVWKIELTAKDDSVSYPKRVSWVDQETFLPLKQELFALSGTLLKTWTMSDSKAYGERWFPSRMVIEDKLQEGTRTTLSFDDLQFSVDLEEEVFSRRWLERR